MRSERRRATQKQNPQPPLAFETLVWADAKALRRFAEWLGVPIEPHPHGDGDDEKARSARLLARALKRGAAREVAR